ncbi:ATP-binding protein [Saccharothrix saharensis]|uniref:ATP-binding protein n=1 Tax=Saccharothrix saharensis TaxID=571190 RepID=UPI003675A2BE
MSSWSTSKNRLQPADLYSDIGGIQHTAERTPHLHQGRHAAERGQRPACVPCRLSSGSEEKYGVVGLQSGQPHDSGSVGEDDRLRGVTNTLSATEVGLAVQIGSVHGDLHLHHPSPVVPRQLPAAPPLFAGRATELAELDRVPTFGTVVISAIGGAGGIGKTWLALTWAHRHLDRFPDGQLFVDLRGFSPAGEPTNPADALRGFLDALGVPPERVPHEPDARAALYRSLISDRRMLVVLDNAATADQVVPLLPGGATCTVLVTSRDRLLALATRHGAHPLRLDVLTDGEARALLTAALGPDRVAADELAVAELIGLCGGFPLALGLIAARVRLGLPLREAVDELRDLGPDALDAADPAASLSAVLSWSLRRLTAEQRTAFALLGIAPGPDTGLPAAAALTGLPPRRAHAVLRALEDASLVDRHADGRRAMHDLIRAWATTVADTLPEPVRSAALDRVVDLYLHTAHTAARLLEPHRQPLQLAPPTPPPHPHPLSADPAALTWLTTEHPHLLAAQRTAADRLRHRAAWHLAWALTPFHQRQGHRSDDLTVWRTALVAAHHLADPTALAHTHRNLGSALSRLNRHQDAIGHLRSALALAEHQEDHLHQASAHHDLSLAWGQQGDDHRALHHARHTLDLYRRFDNPVWEAMALNLVGWCNARVGEHDAARDHCTAALALARRHHNLAGEAATLGNLGYIAHHAGQHGEALDHYRRSLKLLRQIGDAYNEAFAHDWTGQAHTALGHHDHARTAWRQALALYREQGRQADADRIRQQLDDLDHQ